MSINSDDATVSLALGQLMDREQALYMRVFQRLPLAIVRGKGMTVWDDRGREYLDFTSGLGVNTLGHCPDSLIAAVVEQMGRLIHGTNGVYTAPQLELAGMLIEHSAFDRVFFANSGAEANECAIKLARRWGASRKDGAYEIIASRTGYHGRTMATMSCTGHEHFNRGFGPLLPGVRLVDFEDLEALEAAVTDRTVAVLLEPVQGVDGVRIASREYLRAVRALCDRNDILLVFDEVQSGVGRTGTLWAYEHYGIEPDVMSLAKGLGGGLPIGACLAKEHACVLGSGDHGTTFGGNPLVCAGAKAVLTEVLERDLPGHAARLGSYLADSLRALSSPFIEEIRQIGLWLAVQFVDARAARIMQAVAQAGVLVLPTVNPAIIRLMPSLVATHADCDRCVAAIGIALSAGNTEPRRWHDPGAR